MSDPLASRVVTGSAYSIAGSLLTWAMGATRLVLLTRFLLPADVGVAAQAMLFVGLAVRMQTMGLHDAFLQHRAPDEGLQRTYFTLRLLLLAAALAILLLITPWLVAFYPDMRGLSALIAAFAAVEALRLFPAVQSSFIARNLGFRRLAAADVAASAAMAIVAPTLAWLGYGPWALVGEAASGVVARLLVTWHWWPKLGWNTEAAAHFWRFGKALWSNSTLLYLLDNIDDFWVGLTLGRDPLGLYARAYEFAGYPRRVVAAPLLDIFVPTYARLQDDPQRLARAFFRATSLMVRSGFLFALLFISSAPHLIALINPAWLPMVPTLQLMLIYTLLDPLQAGAANLLIATGEPQRVSRARLAQALFFVPMLLLGARLGGINGVALALNGMAALGAWLLFRAVRGRIRYSSRALWWWPTVAAVASGAALGALPLAWPTSNDGAMLAAKWVVGTLIYVGILWATEREALMRGGQMIWTLMRGRRDG